MKLFLAALFVLSLPAISYCQEVDVFKYFPICDELSGTFLNKLERFLEVGMGRKNSHMLETVIKYRQKWETKDPCETIEEFLQDSRPKVSNSETGKVILTSNTFENRMIVVDVYAQYFRLIEIDHNGKQLYLDANYNKSFDELLAKNPDLFHEITHFDYSKLANKRFINRDKTKEHNKNKKYSRTQKEIDEQYFRNKNCNRFMR